MRIYHIATAADWRAARRSGAYTTSTRGRTLAEEGFVHASRHEQVRATYDAFYADAGEPLVLLTVETDRLDAAGVTWREDPVGAQTYPHVYGAIPPAAVVAVAPLDARGNPPSFTTVFLREAVPPVLMAVGLMVLAAVGGTLAGSALGGGAVVPVALAVLVVGALAAVGVSRARSR